MTDTRFHRQELLFGREGQQRIAAATIAIVGVGGIGTRVIQDTVLLGSRRFVLIEPGELKESSKNRYVGHLHDDPVPGTPKLKIGERIIRAVSPDADIIKVPTRLESAEAIAAIETADVVFGCLDDEGPRFSLNEICAKQGKRLIDIATETISRLNQLSLFGTAGGFSCSGSVQAACAAVEYWTWRKSKAVSPALSSD